MARPRLAKKRGKTRSIMHVPLYDDLNVKIQAVIDQTGMSKVEFISRLFTFFSTQEDYIQSQMLGHTPESQRVDFAKMVLRKMADLEDEVEIHPDPDGDTKAEVKSISKKSQTAGGSK